MSDAFYQPDGNGRFISTKRTIGPWGPDSQHGGPPSALLGRAIERVNDRDNLQVANITFDILKPIPIAPLSVTARVARPGKRVELVEATLAADGVEVMRAKAWRIRSTPVDIREPKRMPPPPGPDTDAESGVFDFGTDINYLVSMETRFVSGAFLEPGPATAWFRPLHPLVEGEEISPLCRVLIAIDSASGISAQLDWREWLFVNPDLTVYLHRLPEGSWIGMDAITYPERHGIGMTVATIHDTSGSIGRSLQSLLITPRG
ncbi:MAG: thioesterase family protein [Actinomycetota bacterium]